MSRILGMKENIEKVLQDEGTSWIRYLAFAEKKSGIDRLYIFIASIIFFAIYLIIGVGQQLISNLIGFVYPAYCSMASIETKQTDDDTKWLTYWVVFAVFSIIEYFSEFIVGWFPFYWLSKCLFTIWLMIPTEYNGSLILYRRIIRPKFIQYNHSIDSIIQDVRKYATKPARSSIFDSKNE